MQKFARIHYSTGIGSTFITSAIKVYRLQLSQVDLLKTAHPHDEDFQQKIGDFHRQMSRHVPIMDIARGKQMKMLRAIEKAAEQEHQKLK